MRNLIKMAILLSCCGVVLSSCGKAEENVIKIGVFEPASGDNGAGGKQETLGIQYAHSLVNTITVGEQEYKIELVEEDNQSSTDKAVSAASALISRKVSIVLGSYGSGVSIAAADLFADAKIPAIGISCTNPAVTEGNEYYYRICYLDPFQGTVLAHYAAEEGADTAYVLSQLGDDYSVGLSTYFQKAFQEMGGKVIQQNFPEGTSDFSAYITSAKNAGADVFFAPCSTTVASLILSQASSGGASFQILAGDTWDNSVILEAAKGTSLNIALSSFFAEGEESSQSLEFVTGFRQWLEDNKKKKISNGGNTIVSGISALGYDAYMVAIEAIKAAGSADSQAVADALGKVSYQGVTGSISFDKTGDAVKDAAFIKSVDTRKGVFQFEKIQTVKQVKEK